ncbi:MAG: deoxyribose-phosphate aldolase [Chloroflexi bacterium]|nr:deoxyribose-phosphate aldolase [Chloroflexota bacterium]
MPAGCADCTGQCAVQCEAAQSIIAAGASRLALSVGVKQDPSAVAHLIDHTLLKPEATEDQIAQLCYEARKHQFIAVCVNPNWVRLCKQLLHGSKVKLATVIGFPLGAHATETKVFEAAQAIKDGADELDMVINIGALKAGDFETVERDIHAVVEVAHTLGGIVKVIIEAALLSDDEKTQACILAKGAGADYVKTSTGFGPGGATAHDVALMRRTVGAGLGVKAAGGIKDLATMTEMVKAGATRIGASAGVKIVQEVSVAAAATPLAVPAASRA